MTEGNRPDDSLAQVAGVDVMDETSEGFNDRFSAEELVTIYRAMFASG